MRSTRVERNSTTIPAFRGGTNSFTAANRRAQPKAPRNTAADDTNDTIADTIPGSPDLTAPDLIAPDDTPHHTTDLEA
jgi:hypothetical protein